MQDRTEIDHWRSDYKPPYGEKEIKIPEEVFDAALRPSKVLEVNKDYSFSQIRLAEDPYLSCQGEGVYAGVPMTFVRLQGCEPKPHCRWCDTSYAQDPAGGKMWFMLDVLAKVRSIQPWQFSWVEVTGGEPLVQEAALLDLVSLLKREGYFVEIETNGCMPRPRWWTKVDSWCADIKCPSSGMDVWVREKEWFETLRAKDQVKFVVGTEEDLRYTEMVLRRNMVAQPTVLISPVLKVLPRELVESEDARGLWEAELVQLCEEQVWLQRVAEFVKEMRGINSTVRYSLQIHKFIWPRMKRGV